MIVGPRYNDVDPAVEAAYEAGAEFECGHTHDTESQPVSTFHFVPDPWTAAGGELF